jgi:hypothetical protein
MVNRNESIDITDGDAFAGRFLDSPAELLCDG